jgi:nicotinamide-nucleotide amidase
MNLYEDIIAGCSKRIAENGWSIAFAESATAGKLSYAFSLTEQSGQILKGGLICYDAALKESILGISKQLLETYTPESAEVTREMSFKLRAIMPADLSVAVTGLTTPGGSESPGKPVGTMFYCILINGEVYERRKVFTGTPEEIIDLTIEQVAKTIIKIIEESKK